MNSEIFESDFLVIGSGIAGLSFAIKASKAGTVNIVTKKRETDTNTNYAQGGIASVLSDDDSFESHMKDTLKAGAGLCNRDALELLVRSGPDRINELIQWGTNFSKTKDDEGSRLDLGREGGHSYNRIAHAKDLTGHEIERALLDKISSAESIRMYENHTTIDLLTEHQIGKDYTLTDNDIHCYGAYILNNESRVVHTFRAKIIVLATGGVGQVYLHTTNPDIATGDGIAMAYRAGALIGDMEFMQFHPTSFFNKKQSGPSFLISEAVRGEGGILINSTGERIMEGVHPMIDLAPRDIVARTIDRVLKNTGDECVYIDISSKDKDFLNTRFPQIFNHCLGEGIDISKDPIPVVPAAHYLCGGIISDLSGRTSVKNLYVSGESACTGVHGANRLASNSLLEGIVFSHRAFIHASEEIRKITVNPDKFKFPEWSKEGTFDLNERILVQHNIEDVKRLMWDYVGIVRSDLRLGNAYKRILMLEEEIHNYYKSATISSTINELRNLSTIAKLIIKSAMARKHSIGLHFNSDHPEPDRRLIKIILRSGHENIIVDSNKNILNQ